MLEKRWKVAVVGCGGISQHHYLPEIAQNDRTELVAVCDADENRAKTCADRFGVDRFFTRVDDLLADEDFEILVDVATIQAHFEINQKALEAGKHIYSQKPIASTSAQAKTLIELAEKKGLKISASPIHMLRPEIQEVKRLIDKGTIGKVSFARCSSSHGGPEYFQYRDADPTWFHQPGAGPLLDLGVHGLHQVTGLLGPARRVFCLSGISERVRIARSGAFDGKAIQTSTDDNIHLNLDFGDATFAYIDSTYCVKNQKGPSLEIFGSQGTITFTRSSRGVGMELYLDDRERSVRGWIEPIYRFPPITQSEGVFDLIQAIEEDREPVLSASHALHVIEIMEKAPLSAQTGQALPLETTF